jgi:DNA repair exonuclease SbcCD ATPase subunit
MSTIKSIDLGLKEIKKIYHVSDVHVRNFKRHEEYRRVFKNLKDYVVSDGEPDSVIIVTGDIVHSKTDVTPELVQEVQEFLKLLSSVRPVIITAGNHDANLNNSDRLDTLTPIVNAINSDRIHYLRDGGVYEFCGIHFCVWSVFDAHDSYVKAKDFEGNLKIASYHGAVTNAVTEIGFKLTHERISVRDFEGYDMVLLGDIHKFQYLDERNTIAYPGSLIQQSHGEGLEHGIIVWDIENRNNKFVKIPNDTCYLTVYVEDGNYQVPKEARSYTRAYLRIRHRNTQPSQIKRIVSELKSFFEVVEVSYQHIQNQLEDSSSSSNKLNATNTREIEYQNKIIKEYLHEKYKLSDSKISEVLEINRNVNKSVNKSEVCRNSVWIPKRFEFENMFSYGKGNYVDFTNMEGTYGLFAANASGKSTLLDSITYCVFDKCPKTNKGSQVINNQSDTFSCELTFEMNSQEYVISRSAIRQKNGNVRVEVDFYSIDSNGNKTSLNGKERSDTNANIRKVVGSYEDFVLTTLSTQNGGSGFIDMNQKDRKDLLCQFLDINVFEELYSLANNEHRELTVLLKELNKNNYQDSLIENNNKVKSLEQQLVDLSEQKGSIEDDISKLTEKMLELSSNISEGVTIDYDIEQLLTLKTEYQLKLESIKTKLQQNKEQYDQLQNKKVELETSLDSYPSDSEVENGLIQLDNHLEKRSYLTLEVTKAKTELDAKREKLERLKDLKYDPNCSFCMNNVFVKDAIETSSSFCENLNELSDKVSALDSINYELSGSIVYKSIRDEKTKVIKSVSSLQTKISEGFSIISTINEEIKKKEKQIVELQYKIDLYNTHKQIVENNRVIKNKIQDVKKAIDELKIELSKVSQKMNEVVIDKKLAESDSQRCQESIEKLKNLENRSKSYEYYLNAVHRDGVPHTIISNTLPKIEERINDVLSQLVDFKIVLDSDEKNVNGYIAYEEDRFWPIELTSGMEKFVSSLAIRNALISVSSLPRPNFIAIDEGFGTLDRNNVGTIPLFFDFLKSQFKFVIIVSHIETMRDNVDSHIEINKVDGRSRVTH